MAKETQNSKEVDKEPLFDLSAGGHAPPEDTLEKTHGFSPHLGEIEGELDSPSKVVEVFSTTS